MSKHPEDLYLQESLF